MSKKSSPKGGDARQRNALGRASREQIVCQAEQLLVAGGYHALSTRKVADACGISVGNLTYHFPNKVQLVEAVMIAVCERYEAERATIKFDRAQDSIRYLRGVVTWMLGDAVTPDTSGLFLELWILAKHHDFGCEILERFYRTAAGWITGSLEIYFPHASLQQRERAAYFLLTLSEGAVAVFSRPCKRSVDQADMIEFAVSGVLAMLAQAD